MGHMAHAIVTRGGWTWDGKFYRPGDHVDADERLIRRWAEDGYVEIGRGQVASEPKAERATSTPPAAPDPEAHAADEVPEWHHKMAPDKYLHRFPDGPDADLARRLTGERE